MFNRRDVIKGDSAASAAGLLAGKGWAFGKNVPNIIFILADDLGYADLSCFAHQPE